MAGMLVLAVEGIMSDNWQQDYQSRILSVSVWGLWGGKMVVSSSDTSSENGLHIVNLGSVLLG
mgnify:CR=1 FL=1